MERQPGDYTGYLSDRTQVRQKAFFKHAPGDSGVLAVAVTIVKYTMTIQEMYKM